MVDLKDVRVSMTVVLRHNKEREKGDLEIENFDSKFQYKKSFEIT